MPTITPAMRKALDLLTDGNPHRVHLRTGAALVRAELVVDRGNGWYQLVATPAAAKAVTQRLTPAMVDVLHFHGAPTAIQGRHYRHAKVHWSTEQALKRHGLIDRGWNFTDAGRAAYLAHEPTGRLPQAFTDAWNGARALASGPAPAGEPELTACERDDTGRRPRAAAQPRRDVITAVVVGVTPSAFPGASPVLALSDGSQVYGPYNPQIKRTPEEVYADIVNMATAGYDCSLPAIDATLADRIAWAERWLAYENRLAELFEELSLATNGQPDWVVCLAGTASGVQKRQADNVRRYLNNLRKDEK